MSMIVSGPAAHDRPPRRPRRGGFTLIELLIVVGIMTLLMGAIGSLVTLSARAVSGTGAAAQDAPLDTLRGLQPMLADIQFATSVSAGSRTSITLTLPDRGSGAQVCTYSWSGKSGDPLIRTLGTSSTTIVPKVYALTLAYDKRTDTSTTSATSTSAEQLLFTSNPTTVGLSQAGSGRGWATVVSPSLAGDAVSWSVTRVVLSLGRAGTTLTDTGVVNLYLVNGSTWTQLWQSETILESTLPASMSWQTFSPTGVGGLSTTSQLGIGFVQTLGPLDGFAVGRTSSACSGHSFYQTTTSGTSWSSTTGCLGVSVYGIVTGASAATTTTTSLVRVRIDITAGSPSSAPVRTSARVLNRPGVSW